MSSPDPPAETQPETSGRDIEQKPNGDTTTGTTVEVDNAGVKKIRVLAVYCVSDEDEDDKGFDPPDASNVLHLAARPDVEVSSKQLHRRLEGNFTRQLGRPRSCELPLSTG